MASGSIQGPSSPLESPGSGGDDERISAPAPRKRTRKGRWEAISHSYSAHGEADGEEDVAVKVGTSTSEPHPKVDEESDALQVEEAQLDPPTPRSANNPTVCAEQSANLSPPPHDGFEEEQETSTSDLEHSPRDLVEPSRSPMEDHTAEIFELSESGQSSEMDSDGGLKHLGARERMKLHEAQRLANVLTLAERGCLSQRRIRMLLQTDVVASRFSYDSLKRFIARRTAVSKRYGLMCPMEHATLFGNLPNTRKCPVHDCNLDVSESHRLWYRKISEQLAALCREPHSFSRLRGGCERAQRAVRERNSDIMYYFYDGRLFGRLHGRRMEKWDSNTEMIVFLTLSSDGFEEFRGRSGARTTWPLVFVILNLGVEDRFHACNALFGGFVPGIHDADHFEKFLVPIIEDLVRLEKGIDVRCADGVVRKLYCFVLFITADWPGASKMLGFKGHMALKPCRVCHKKASPVCGKSWLLPSGSISERRAAISGLIVTSWIDAECAQGRTHGETCAVWRRLERIIAEGGRGYVTSLEKLKRNTGVKWRPAIAKLSVNMVESTPYDPMHLWLLGWVKHLLNLCIGAHPRAAALQSAFILNENTVKLVNNSLSDARKGVPSAWGRPPESLEYISSFRAEDFKSITLYYSVVVFNGDRIDKRIAKLWALTSDITFIICDPTPRRDDVKELRSLLQKAHALFTDVFYIDVNHAFCFTPTTHDILHLPEMLERCGPLTNVSQFVVERVAGEVGELISSRSRPESNLFHKSHTLFSLRLLHGGMGITEVDDAGEDDRVNEELGQLECTDKSNVFAGRGRVVGGGGRVSQVTEYVKRTLPITAYDVTFGPIRSFQRATLGVKGSQFKAETDSGFLKRQGRTARHSRQKCWVAANFISESHTETMESDKDGTMSDVYYGKVREFWEVDVSYRTPTEQVWNSKRFHLVRADWQYGLRVDSLSGAAFTQIGSVPRRGSIRHVDRTVEDVDCIQRVIGYIDHGGRRYFLDPEGRSVKRGFPWRLGGTL